MLGMQKTKSNTVTWSLLLPALLGGAGAYAVEIGTKSLKLQPTQAIADTQAPARRQGALNINGVNWNCGGARCSASISPAVSVVPVALCQGLARQAGAIQSFSFASRSLSGAELQQCNSVVPTAQASPGFMPVPQLPAPGATPPTMQPPAGLPPGAMPGAPAMKPIGIPAAPDAKMNMPPPAASNSPFAVPPTGAKPGKGFLPDTAVAPKSTTAPSPAPSSSGGSITVEANYIARAKSGAALPGTEAPSASTGGGAIAVEANFIARPKTGSNPMGTAAASSVGAATPIGVEVNYIARPKSR
jgi:hypothetical protein